MQGVKGVINHGFGSCWRFFRFDTSSFDATQLLSFDCIHISRKRGQEVDKILGLFINSKINRWTSAQSPEFKSNRVNFTYPGNLHK